MATERLFKVLGHNGWCCHGGIGRWRLPTSHKDGTWRPGAWMPSIDGPLMPCVRGYHLVTLEQLPRWLGPTIWEAEYEGPCLREEDKLVVGRARLLRPVETWTERTARLFAADCAERVLPFFERLRPHDARPRKAIEVARRYAEGTATVEELSAARGAAYAAVANAARAAAAEVAADAAWAARTAAYAVANAAWAAARSAVANAAWVAWEVAAHADRAAADEDAERRWQAARLAHYLFGDAGRE